MLIDSFVVSTALGCIALLTAEIRSLRLHYSVKRFY